MGTSQVIGGPGSPGFDTVTFNNSTESTPFTLVSAKRLVAYVPAGFAGATLTIKVVPGTAAALVDQASISAAAVDLTDGEDALPLIFAVTAGDAMTPTDSSKSLRVAAVNNAIFVSDATEGVASPLDMRVEYKN